MEEVVSADDLFRDYHVQVSYVFQQARTKNSAQR